MEKKQDKKKEPERFIRFDWAAKRLLRDKANFGVLEGLLTVLLGDGEHPVHIVEILESESNQLHMKDKFNRVDIKARNAEGEIILVEIQSNWELYFIERLLFGTSPQPLPQREGLFVSPSPLERGTGGEAKVKKVYSICILYFSLGQGADYLYHGQTTFVGVHTGDELRISEKEKKALVPRLPSEIFPEYYLIRVDEFNKVATTPLEEWIEFLKTEKIRPDTTTPGLQEARRKMNFYSLSKAEQEAYRFYVDEFNIQKESVEGGYQEGLFKGRAEGEADKREMVRKMLAEGLPLEQIARITGLSPEFIRCLK